MLNNIIVRLVIHYLATLLLFGGVAKLFPEGVRYIAAERLRSGREVPMDLSEQARAVASGEVRIGVSQLLDPTLTGPVLAALVGAFLMVLPVAWVYRWTRSRKRYDQGFAHTLLVVPISIALVVFLVKGSLALAFSLAGIVGVMRFRTALNEPMDAVYMFIVIGIGLAAGVQLAMVALLASVVFNVVALAVWRLNYGADPAQVSGWTLLPAGDVGRALRVTAGRPPEGPNGEPHKKPFNAVLRLRTTQVDAAEKAVIPVLEESAKNWQISQVVRNEDGTSTVEIDVRLRKSTDVAAFVKSIEANDGGVNKVELTKHPRKAEP